MEKVLTLIMAGGAGDRLQPLTKERAKPAVPFGGKFRIIDFTLSNCINSGMRQVFVLTQYRSGSLHQHVQDGWGISSAGLGDFVYCVPAQQKAGLDWYRGTADALRQNIDLMTKRGYDSILVLSGDHIYKMNYSQMVRYHRARGAEVTISAIRVRKEEAAGRLGVIEVDHSHRVVGFEEKPQSPKTVADAPDHCFASMGVYAFKIDTLLQILKEPGDDFGRDVIPRIVSHRNVVFVYDYGRENRIEDFVVEVRNGMRQKVLAGKTRDSSYWRDVGTIDSYYDACMELVGIDPQFNLYGERWPFRTYQKPLSPSKFVLGGSTSEAIVSEGCIISGGNVWRSILSPGVVVERHAQVAESVLLDDVIVEPEAKVRRAIVDKNVRILAGASLGYDLEADRARGCTVSEKGIVVAPKGMVVGP